MSKTPRNLQIQVAIPNSSVFEDQTLREKSLKIASFARSFSIFGITKVFIYDDKTEKKNPNLKKIDEQLLFLLLDYLNTPQYLRRSIYPKNNLLQYAGILPPLKTPSHVKKIKLEEIKVGDIRQGIILEKNNHLVADVGLDQYIRFRGPNDRTGKKLNLKFISKYPNPEVIEISTNEIMQYWGYETVKTDLKNLLQGVGDDTLIIITSKKGIFLSNIQNKLLNDITEKKKLRILLIFGSPSKMVEEIMAIYRINLKSNEFYTINFFPRQNTETVRLEEAIFGSLSCLNVLLN